MTGAMNILSLPPSLPPLRSLWQAALLTAAQLLDADAVEMFLKMGEDPLAVNGTGNTALHLVSNPCMRAKIVLKLGVHVRVRVRIQVGSQLWLG